MISKFCKFSAFSLKPQKYFSITRTIFFSQKVKTILITKYHDVIYGWPLLWSALRGRKAKRPAERPNQCNALDKLKRCGKQSSKVCGIPSCMYGKAFDTIKQGWWNLGGKGGIPPVPDFGRSVNPIPGALFSHLPPSLCIILNMHNQMEFCTDIMIILGARSGPKTFWKGSIPLKLQYRWLFWIVRDYLQDLLSWSKIQLCAK